MTKKKIKVLYINHTILKSGAAISLGTLIKNFPEEIEPYFILRKNCQIEEIIGAQGKQIYYERFMPQFMTTVYNKQYNIILFLWQVLKVPMAWLHLFYLLKKWRIDIVHLNETTLISYAFLIELLNLPLVIHARTAIAKRPKEIFALNLIGKYEKALFLAIDGEVKYSFPLSCHDKIKIVYNPIEKLYSPSVAEIKKIRYEWGCNAENIIIGQVSSLHSQKGIWTILDLAKRLVPLFSKIKFVLVGDFSADKGEGAALIKEIKKYNLMNYFVLPGYNSKRDLIYNAFDIALCLFGESLRGLGRPAFEAVINRKPLIATLPNPDMTTTLIHKVHAYLFRPSDFQSILNGLRELIESVDKREAIVVNSADILVRHDPDAIAEIVTKVYYRLLDNSKFIGSHEKI